MEICANPLCGQPLNGYATIGRLATERNGRTLKADAFCSAACCIQTLKLRRAQALAVERGELSPAVLRD